MSGSIRLRSLRLRSELVELATSVESLGAPANLPRDVHTWTGSHGDASTHGSKQEAVELVRFFTAANSRFFVGAAALLDSLRRSGNTAPAYVVDAGLEPDERERLAELADVLDLPPQIQGIAPLFAKLTADLFWSSGVVVLLDSDMIVTSQLDDLVTQAADGKIAVHPDHPITAGRRFDEWRETFELRRPPRPQQYVNTSPLALSLDRWPRFLERWRSACTHLPSDWPSQGFVGPYGLADQDALNALLMSEVPPEAIWTGSDARTVHADGLCDVEILDTRTLACRYRGSAPVVLHYGLSPKAWEQSAWRRIRKNDAYVRLLRRLLFAPDAVARARTDEVPIWLRPKGVGRIAAALLGLVNFARVDLRNRARLGSRIRLLRRRVTRRP